MILRVFHKTDMNDNETVQYTDTECTSWEATANLLILHRDIPSQTICVPLINIGSFCEAPESE